MNTIELMIDGMSCKSCVSTVTGILQQQTGVQHVHVDLEHHKATIDTGESFNRQQTIAALAEAGFDAS